MIAKKLIIIRKETVLGEIKSCLSLTTVFKRCLKGPDLIENTLLRWYQSGQVQTIILSERLIGLHIEKYAKMKIFIKIGPRVRLLPWSLITTHTQAKIFIYLASIAYLNLNTILSNCSSIILFIHLS